MTNMYVNKKTGEIIEGNLLDIAKMTIHNLIHYGFFSVDWKRFEP